MPQLSCRHTTLASTMSQSSSHTVPHEPLTLTATKTRDPSRDNRSQTAGFQHLHSLSTTRWPRMAA
ncbi:hypothetical protein EYF80_024765 [Liparis tanakae]|uniref:Uncharacterized protein n=1 Tax=Liparis tanakae TaxID=230148 RepID=A0A4Z2HH20_9TELE|nr:hypothetical protein EYF80_024765 [Liparis tanakae]